MLSAQPDLSERLFPTAMRVRLGGSAREFLDMYGVSPLLCIELPDGSASALLGDLLNSKDVGEASSRAPLSYETAMASELHAPGTQPASALRSRLMESHHFVLPLAKRAKRASSHHLSVGRTRDNEVVLRDATVSKVHAWFELDPHGHVKVADAGSRNGSTLSGVRLVPKQPVAVPPGAPITFGKIRAFTCGASALWEACHGGTY